jgi:hypothetical protein
MRDLKEDLDAGDYSSKATDSFQKTGAKWENAAEKVTKGAAAATETIHEAYSKAQESVQKESEVRARTSQQICT